MFCAHVFVETSDTHKHRIGGLSECTSSKLTHDTSVFCKSLLQKMCFVSKEGRDHESLYKGTPDLFFVSAHTLFLQRAQIRCGWKQNPSAELWVCTDHASKLYSLVFLVLYFQYLGGQWNKSTTCHFSWNVSTCPNILILFLGIGEGK